MRVLNVNPFQTPFGKYTKFGSNRPSAEMAERLYTSVMERGDGNKPSALVMASEICLDAFVDCSVNNSSNGVDWLGNAKDLLKQVITEGEQNLSSGRLKRGGLRDQVDAYTVAQFRMAEIKYWGKAAAREPLTSNYKAVRRAGRKTLPMAVICPEINSRLCEAVPVLLGERAQAHELPTAKWFGRQALTREDKGRKRDRNWDTGISLSRIAERFMFPDLRIQVKSGGSDARIAKNYDENWVSGLAATANGFANAAGIILGCCLEEGDDIPLSEGQILALRPVGTAELNRVTERLDDRFQSLALVA
ncbi:MAG: hypothetical protein AAB436_00235 [Patescibacteria group bacterium]